MFLFVLGSTTETNPSHFWDAIETTTLLGHQTGLLTGWRVAFLYSWDTKQCGEYWQRLHGVTPLLYTLGRPFISLTLQTRPLALKRRDLLAIYERTLWKGEETVLYSKFPESSTVTAQRIICAPHVGMMWMEPSKVGVLEVNSQSHMLVVYFIKWLLLDKSMWVGTLGCISALCQVMVQHEGLHLVLNS